MATQQQGRQRQGSRRGSGDEEGTAGAAEPELPSDRELEIGMLRCILDPYSSAEAYEAVAQVQAFTEDDLYFHEHRAIYRTVRTVAAKGDIPEIGNVLAELRLRNMMDEAGGEDYIHYTIFAEAGVLRLAGQYARRIHELAERRRIIEQAQMLATVAYRGDTETLQAVCRGVVATLADDENAAAEAPDLSLYLTDEEAANLPPARGILGDILYEDSVIYVYAPTGRWKTFVAVSWGMCIATNTPWLGRSVVEGDVLYIAAEGARGIGQRVAAWKRRHGVTGKTRIIIRKASLDLDVDKQVSGFIRDMELLEIHPVLIVFDTLATSTNGNENESETAKAVAKAARRMIRACEGACVLIIHHTGYDATHMRGSSEFEADSDSTIRIEGGEAGKDIEVGEPIFLTCDKPFKDGEKFKRVCLTTDVETWAVEETGEIRRSLVIVAGDEAAAEQRKAKTQEKGMTPKRQRALDALTTPLTANEWQRVSGMCPSAFFQALTYFQDADIVTFGDDGRYARAIATPVTPLRSGFTPAGVDARAVGTPLRSGVSIDTGATGVHRGTSEDAG